MKILVRETVSHFHEVEMSDEIDIQKLLDAANIRRNEYNTGYEAIESILASYKEKYGEAFDFNINPNLCGTRCEEIEYERILEE